MVSYGFQPGRRAANDAKKEPPFPAAFEVDNREASNRVDRSHSVSKEDDASHKRESLIDRKREIFFSLHLPCRPLAYLSVVMAGLVPRLSGSAKMVAKHVQDSHRWWLNVVSTHLFGRVATKPPPRDRGAFEK
jgi:hypothetical protein